MIATNSSHKGGDSDRSNNLISLRKVDDAMVVYEKELRVYSDAESVLSGKALLRETSPKKKWELEFVLKVKGKRENAILVTSLNKPRLFPNLHTIVELLNDTCPDLENIDLGLTKLERKGDG